MSIIKLIDLFLSLVGLLFLVRVLLSWIPSLERSSFGQLVFALTEPILKPIRPFVTFGGSGMAFDFSPVVVLFIIQILRQFLRG